MNRIISDSLRLHLSYRQYRANSIWSIGDQQEMNKWQNTSEDDHTLLDNIMYMRDQNHKGAKCSEAVSGVFKCPLWADNKIWIGLTWAKPSWKGLERTRLELTDVLRPLEENSLQNGGAYKIAGKRRLVFDPAGWVTSPTETSSIALYQCNYRFISIVMHSYPKVYLVLWQTTTSRQIKVKIMHIIRSIVRSS